MTLGGGGGGKEAGPLKEETEKAENWKTNERASDGRGRWDEGTNE